MSGVPDVRPRSEFTAPGGQCFDVYTDAGGVFRWEIAPDRSKHVAIIVIAIDDFIIVHAHIDLSAGVRFDGCQDGVLTVGDRRRPRHRAGVIGQPAQPQAAASCHVIGDGGKLSAGIGSLRSRDDAAA